MKNKFIVLRAIIKLYLIIYSWWVECCTNIHWVKGQTDFILFCLQTRHWEKLSNFIFFIWKTASIGNIIKGSKLLKSTYYLVVDFGELLTLLSFCLLLLGVLVAETRRFPFIPLVAMASTKSSNLVAETFQNTAITLPFLQLNVEI